MKEFKIGDKVFSPKIKCANEHGNGIVRLLDDKKPLRVRVSFENGYWKAFSGENRNIYDILCHGWLIQQD